ncbi:hypothetical protein GCM10010193_28500 [Kitasatospora atroaurantiaca]
MAGAAPVAPVAASRAARRLPRSDGFPETPPERTGARRHRRPNRRRKGTANTLAVLRSIRAARPDGAPAYVILDNLSAHNGKKILRWAKNNNVHLCFTPTNDCWE